MTVHSYKGDTMKYQIGLSILVLAFSACMKVKKKDDSSVVAEARAEQLTEVSQLQNSDLVIKYQGQSKPNQYSAVLSWPQIPGSTFRMINANNEIFETTENSYTVHNLIGGKEYKIIFEQFTTGDQKRLTVFDVIMSAPVDMLLDGPISLAENVDKTVERLFLTATAKVFTNQFNLKIKSKFIYSEFGALITNFPENFVAAMQTVGLSGGKIEISTTVAEGNLQILMNAQQGGEGLWGWKSIPPLIGGTGQSDGPGCLPNSGFDSGNSGTFIFISEQGSKMSFTTDMKVSAGGQIGNYMDSDIFVGTIVDRNKVKLFRYPDCQKIPTLGKPGKPGQICMKMNTAENFVCEKF